MRVIAVANQKGGVGKTSTCVALAGQLYELGQKVLLIDLDPHGSLTHYFRVTIDDPYYTAYKLFTQKELMPNGVKTLCQNTSLMDVDIIPGHQSLATIEQQRNIAGLGMCTKKALHKVKNDYDFVLIDCPPVIGILMINALAACDLLVMPVQTEYLAIHGLGQMLKTINMIEISRNISVNFKILPTMYDKNVSACRASLNKLNRLYPDNITKVPIPVDMVLKDASQHGIVPSIFAPKSPSVGAYKVLLKEVLQAMIAKDKSKIK